MYVYIKQIVYASGGMLRLFAFKQHSSSKLAKNSNLNTIFKYAINLKKEKETTTLANRN